MILFKLKAPKGQEILKKGMAKCRENDISSKDMTEDMALNGTRW